MLAEGAQVVAVQVVQRPAACAHRDALAPGVVILLGRRGAAHPLVVVANVDRGDAAYRAHNPAASLP